MAKAKVTGRPLRKRIKEAVKTWINENLNLDGILLRLMSMPRIGTRDIMLDVLIAA